MGFSNSEPLPHDDRNIPYFLEGDDTFPLRPWMVNPYSHRYLTRDKCIFNYRVSRCWRVVENAFGILANCFRCLLTTLVITPPTTTKVVKAYLCLHNLMRAQYPDFQNAGLDGENEEGGIVPGAGRDAGFLADMDQERRPPRETCEGKMQ